MFKLLASKSRFYIFWLALCLLAPLPQAYGQPGSTPAFWKVSSAYSYDSRRDGVLYLLGSIHLGTAGMYPLPEEIYEAFDQSKILAVEVDISSLDPAETQTLLIEYAQFPYGKTLKSHLSKKRWKKLRQVSTRYHFPLEEVQSMRPWFVMMQLENAVLNQAGYNELYGVDLHFLSKVGKQKIVSIETLEEQLGLFSKFSNSEEAYLLDQALEEFGNFDQQVAPMLSAWEEGDMDALEQTILGSLDRSHPAGEKFYQLLFVRRNKLMAQEAEKILRSGKTGFMVVGAGHMVGEQGIVAILKQREHTVERLDFSR